MCLKDSYTSQFFFYIFVYILPFTKKNINSSKFWHRKLFSMPTLKHSLQCWNVKKLLIRVVNVFSILGHMLWSILQAPKCLKSLRHIFSHSTLSVAIGVLRAMISNLSHTIKHFLVFTLYTAIYLRLIFQPNCLFHC